MIPGFSLGTLVEHTVWGLGKIVETSGSHLVVHFTSLGATEAGPRRKMQAQGGYLTVSAAQSEAHLDAIPIGPARASKKTAGSPRKQAPPAVHDLERTITWFETTYPGRFQDPRLIEEELKYKRDAHELWVERFGGDRGRRLLDDGEAPRISDGLDRIHHATNIPSRFEIMAAHDGYKDGVAASRVLAAILDFVAMPGASSFDAVASAIGSLPAPAKGSRVLTWPNVTILLFLADPTRFMVVKPEITRRMARRMKIDILYSAKPTWHTYEAVLQMSARLLDRLKGLGAKDYIDVQSFVWVTAKLD